MILTLNTEDPRDVKALQLAATAAVWQQNQYGQYLIPAASRDGCYLTTDHSCSCDDHARGNRCKHMRGLSIFLALREASEPKPKPVPVEAARPEWMARVLGSKPPIYRTDHRLCHAPGTRDRECAKYLGHSGDHSFVPVARRED